MDSPLMMITENRSTGANIGNHHSTIRLRRNALGLSQRQLAAAADCCLSTVQNIEAGVTRRGVATLKILETLEYHETQRTAA